MRPAIHDRRAVSRRWHAARLAAGLCLAALACHRGGEPAGGTGATYVRITAPRDSEVAFTSHTGENGIPLAAELSGPAAGASVTWEVTPEPASGAAGGGDTPPAPPPGARTKLTVPRPTAARWGHVAHPASAAARARELETNRLAFRIVAVASKGANTWRSASVVIRQTEASTIREEYLDLKVPQGAPPAGSLVRQAPGGTAAEPNNGDYQYAVRNASFDALFAQLRQNWLSVHPAKEWQVNSGYRNPVHNMFHVSKGVGSGAVSSSWHQYGCAADLQTFPATRSTPAQMAEAVRFWEALANEALLLGFDVEPLQSANGSFSGIAHVHVEKDCPQ
jgi:hypothetical protein